MNKKLYALLVLAMLVMLVGASAGTAQAQTGITIDQDTLGAAFETPYNQQLTASGGTEPYTFSLLSGALPSGITLSSDGLLSGFPDGSTAAPGTYPITIQVEDSAGATASRGFDFVLAKGDPTVIAHAPNDIYWNVPFTLWAEVKKEITDYQSAVLDGTVAFSIDGNPVPGCEAVPEVNGYYQCNNVSMNLTVGTHTTSAAYTPTGWFTNYFTPGSDSSEFTVQPRVYTIQGSLFTDDNQDGKFEEEESRLLMDGWTVNLDQGCDGSVDYTLTTSWGGFVFQNIPTSGQCHRITVIGAPGYQQTTQLADFIPDAYTFIMVGFYYPTITLSPSVYELPSGSVGVDYNQAFGASGGTEPYAYTIQKDVRSNIPDGLTLSPDGVLSGTPTATGHYNFTVQAEDANHATGWHSYNLNIKTDATFTFTSSSSPSAPGEAVTFTLSATGDVVIPDYGPVLPVGQVTFYDDGTAIDSCSDIYLNLDLSTYATGDFPAECITSTLSAGSHVITATYTDLTQTYNDATKTLTQLVGQQKVTPTLSTTISTPTYFGHLFNLGALVRANSQDVPGSVDFAIDGTAVAACQSVALDANDQYFCEGVDLTLAVGNHTLAASFTPKDTGSYNSVSESISFTVVAGSYQIQGNVFEDQNKDGVYNVSEYGSFGWTINLTTCAGDAVIDTNGNIIAPQVSAYGGWFLFSNVPGGQCIRLSEEAQPGWQSTTPTEVDLTLSQDVYPVYFGNYYPRIIVSTVDDPLPGASVGEAYGPVTFTATGGEDPYTYTLKDGYGALPDGLLLSAEGALSGTPTMAGAFYFAVQAEDQGQAAGYAYYSIMVTTDGTFDLSSSSNPSTLGEAVTFTFSASGEALDPYSGGKEPPYGQVTFQADGVDIEGCTGMNLNFDVVNYTYGDYPAGCTTSALEPGTHEITALYTDGTGYFHDATLTLTQVVNAQSISADLAIDKTDSKDPVKPGAKLVYTLTVSNLGPNAAESVVLTDKLDPSTTFGSVSAPRGWTCKYTKNNATVTCTSNSLASGGSTAIKITVTVSKTAKVGKDLVNTAQVTSATYDPNSTNNAVTQKTSVIK